MIRTPASLLALQRVWPGPWCASKRLASACSSAWPRSCDVLVVGGGAVGSSSAYHLTQRAGKDLSVVVLEQDFTYEKASTVLSLSNIRQQFSVAENTRLSLYGVTFLRKASELLAVKGQEPPDVRFVPRGYLFLATPERLKQMEENYKQQTSLGAELAWLWPNQLRQRYPWLTFGENIAAGVVGTNNEGWFDPWSLLMGMRRKAESLGAIYLPAKLTGLQYRQQESDGGHGVTTDTPKRLLTTAQMRLKNGEEREISFSTLVVAAGAWSGEVGRLAGLGSGEGILATPIPVEPRKRFVYCVHSPDGPWEGCPVFNDYTGMYFRPDSRPQHFFCGRSPREEEEPDPSDLCVDYSFFDTHVWPLMVERCPEFGHLKVKGAWAGYYDYNTLDQNLILGFHPVYTNMCIATGMSGHGGGPPPPPLDPIDEIIQDILGKDNKTIMGMEIDDIGLQKATALKDQGPSIALSISQEGAETPKVIVLGNTSEVPEHPLATLLPPEAAAEEDAAAAQVKVEASKDDAAAAQERVAAAKEEARAARAKAAAAEEEAAAARATAGAARAGEEAARAMKAAAEEVAACARALAGAARAGEAAERAREAVDQSCRRTDFNLRC